MSVQPAPGLGPGGVLLHIGVHKTGTTAIQDALAGARPELGQWSVRYPGRQQGHRDIASAAMGRPLGWRTDGARPPDASLWRRTLEEARGYDGVTVISSEFLAEADTATAQAIVDALGVGRTHVVVTLRNLGRILPSAWQQNLKSGFATPYADWLERILREPVESPPPGTFWNRHRHGEIVERWAGAAGADRVTVVVVDETRPEAIYADFEDLLGLPRDTLLAHRVASNRSMTRAEAEFMRRLNLAVGGRAGWAEYPHATHDRIVKAIVEGRTPGPDEARLATPQWALDEAARHGADTVAAIGVAGVHVRGDLSLLTARLTGPETIDDADESLPLDVAVAAALGAASTSRREATTGRA